MMATKTTITEPAPLLLVALLLAGLLIGLAGCGTSQEEGAERGAGGEEAHGASWAVTAWGERYEIFPEIDALAAGESAEAHVHVTSLDGFAPVEEGAVAIVLADGSGGERAYRADAPSRPGIFTVELSPERAGEHCRVFAKNTASGVPPQPRSWVSGGG
jgi:hypothetical protein